MVRCALIHGAATVRVVLCDVRCDFHVAQFGDELVGVIPLIRSQRDAVCAGQSFGHQQRGITFRRTIGSRGQSRNHQTVAVFRQ